MRICHTALIAAQTNGYPVGGYQPAIRCIFTPTGTATAGTATYDYSFNPTVLTNRLIQAEQRESIGDDGGTLIISNYDKSVPDNLTGYYVDLGWGLNTASSVMWDAGTANAVAPRMWVMQQSEISGGAKNSQPQLYKVYELGGVWSAVLNQQPVRIGYAPYYQDETGTLANQTVYTCISLLITALNSQTGMSFTLDALGTQDDGLISTIIPFPIVTAGSFVVNTQYNILTTGTTDYTLIGGVLTTAGAFIVSKRYIILTVGTTDFTLIGATSNNIDVIFYATGVGAGTGTAYEVPFIASGVGAGTGTAMSSLRSLNPQTTGQFQTYAQFVQSLLELTKCVLIARAGLAFKIVYPQSSDAVQETYYSSQASGHPFYENMNRRLNMSPNYVEVFGKEDASISAKWYDTDHFSGTAYVGNFMPVIKSIWEQSFSSTGQCSNRASAEGLQLKQQLLGGRVIIPMDARVELMDRTEMDDSRV